jgi:hypothetical protein
MVLRIFRDETEDLKNFVMTPGLFLGGESLHIWSFPGNAK